MSTTPPRRDYTLYRGDRWDRQINVTEGGAPFDLTAFTFTSQIRSHPNASTVLTTVTVDETSKASGVLWLRLTDVQTATLPARTLAYDLQGSDERTWMRGSINVTGDVTHG